ncbi:hypothetical protein TWF506_010781 [Arthrobotrys conoides]|uniref:Uncharacterized protein n=1 Tax=Arthrobotrys conoides TaxID=74498 RepID=A0AAN8N6Y2_9PEZI
MIYPSLTPKIHTCTGCYSSHYSIHIDTLEPKDTYFVPTNLTSQVIDKSATNTLNSSSIEAPGELQPSSITSSKSEIKSEPLLLVFDGDGAAAEAGESGNKDISPNCPIVFTDDSLQAAFEGQLLKRGVGGEKNLCPDCVKAREAEDEK